MISGSHLRRSSKLEFVRKLNSARGDAGSEATVLMQSNEMPGTCFSNTSTPGLTADAASTRLQSDAIRYRFESVLALTWILLKLKKILQRAFGDV